jgi:poly(hydroxyalkanoate) depolymerase family esterase
MSLSIARLGLGLTVLALVAGCGSATDDPSDLAEENLASSSDALTSVASFGSNPGNLKMYTYTPAGVGDNAPLVVVLHGCTQTANDYVNAGWNQLADTWKFQVVYAEQQTANHSNRCFNWYETGDIQRDAGEALSIKQMVDYVKAHASIDPSRVYVTGLSAGGAMTAVMLATYPDVFAGGAIVAGLPYKCATSLTETTTCMYSGKDQTPAQWGNLVRGAYSSYAGPRPKVSIWHGTGDTTVKPSNATEGVEQWTNVLGIDATADATSTVSGATRSEYRDANGNTLVEWWSIPNMGHGTPVDPGYSPAGGCGTAGAYILDVNLCSTYRIGQFFGLDQSVTSGSSSSSSSGSGSSSSSSSGSGGAGGSGSGSSSSSSGSGGSGGSNPPPATCEEFYDANYYHVTKGRAVKCGSFNSYVCALGSNQNLGLYNMIYTWVKKTGDNYYEAGRCQ